MNTVIIELGPFAGPLLILFVGAIIFFVNWLVSKPEPKKSRIVDVQPVVGGFNVERWDGKVRLVEIRPPPDLGPVPDGVGDSHQPPAVLGEDSYRGSTLQVLGHVRSDGIVVIEEERVTPSLDLGVKHAMIDMPYVPPLESSPFQPHEDSPTLDESPSHSDDHKEH